MFTGIMTGHDDLIGVACECKLSESDLKRMQGLLQERLQETSEPGLGPRTHEVRCLQGSVCF